MKHCVFPIIAILLILISCKPSSKEDISSPIFGTEDLNSANRRLLEIAMEDGFPPPIASRVYVYPHLAHYIALQNFYPDSLPEITKNIKGLDSFPKIDPEIANPELSALLAFCMLAKKVVFSEHYAGELASSFELKAKHNGLDENTIAASKRYAEAVSQELIAWMNKDNYVETRTMDRFTSAKEPGFWNETPPDYQAGLEPHWNKLRTLVVDSASIYVATPLSKYETTKGTPFYEMALEVYNQSKIQDSSFVDIAWFWDDNPNISKHQGHLVTMEHKIAPPGHWLNIIHQISGREKSSLFKTTKAYTFTAIAMYDGIITCWNEKYRTNVIRPITYIQLYIDVNWKPIIQTPPFPEYPSGHSVISASAATVLSEIYGENYPFVDSTQVLFGREVRSYDSFDQAAWEVSLSRFYAGIHYMNGIEEGYKQGNFIGKEVLNKMRQ